MILVADIERGGVNPRPGIRTIILLPELVRPAGAGIIINKFRGDPAIFAPGVKMIEELTGVPVLDRALFQPPPPK